MRECYVAWPGREVGCQSHTLAQCVDCHIRSCFHRPPPILGMRFSAPSSMGEMTWLGRGPFECYIDRKRAAAPGLYSASVESQVRAGKRLETNRTAIQGQGIRLCEVRNIWNRPQEQCQPCLSLVETCAWMIFKAILLVGYAVCTLYFPEREWRES